MTKKSATYALVGVLTVTGFAAWMQGSRRAVPHSIPVDAKNERVRALSEAIRTSGHPCGSITRLYFQGQSGEGVQLWNVACAEGQAYVLSGHDDNTEHIVTCDQLKAATNVDCFSPMPP
jgi:hypothetical protein